MWLTDSIKRRCRMPGCDEVLPPQTCLERCVKCSIGDWKRRKLTSIDASDPSRRRSTTSLTTDTTMEEEEVTTMLDAISDAENEQELPPPSSSPSKSGSDGPTGDHTIRPISGWDSDLTELSSDLASESASDSDSEPESTQPDGHSPRLTIRIPLLVNRLPPNSPHRKCSNKRCNIALPKNHRWKTCDPCRGAQRVYQRMRLENIRRSILGIGE